MTTIPESYTAAQHAAAAELFRSEAEQIARFAYLASLEVCKQACASGALDTPTTATDARAMVEAGARVLLSQDEVFQNMLASAAWHQARAAVTR